MNQRRSLLLPSLVWCCLLSSPTSAVRADTPSPTAVASAALDRDPHLVGWWKLDEPEGQLAQDASPHRRHATLEGGASFHTHAVTGRIGTAVKLEGRDQCLRVTGYKGITGTQPRTVAVWLKTAVANGELAAWGHDDFGRMWTLGFIRGRIGVTPKGGYLYMKAPVNDNSWHHVAVVLGQADRPNLHDHVKLFLDGELAEIDDIGLLDLWPIDTGDTLEVRIGRGFTGCLDDLRLYDRPLSEEEIKRLYESAGPVVTGRPRAGRTAP